MENKRLAPIYGHWSDPLVSVDETLKPILPEIPNLDCDIKVAKDSCAYPLKDNLTTDELAVLYLYTRNRIKIVFIVC